MGTTEEFYNLLPREFLAEKAHVMLQYAYTIVLTMNSGILLKQIPQFCLENLCQQSAGLKASLTTERDFVSVTVSQ